MDIKRSRARVTLGGQYVLLQNSPKKRKYFKEKRQNYRMNHIFPDIFLSSLKIQKITENRLQSTKNAPKLIKICKIYDVDKSTLVLVFNSF